MGAWFFFIKEAVEGVLSPAVDAEPGPLEVVVVRVREQRQSGQNLKNKKVK